MNISPQKPARGVLKYDDYDDWKFFHIRCDCTDDDHSHEMCVESGDCGVTVSIHTTQYLSPYVRGFWRSLWMKLKATWNVWFGGYIKYSSDMILNEQTALNYADALTNSVQDVLDHSRRYGKK